LGQLYTTPARCNNPVGCNAAVTRRQRRRFKVAGMAGNTTGERDLKYVPTDELQTLARTHELRFARSEACDGAAGVELFRRAIVEQDDAAWRAVVEVYRGVLAAHAGRRAVRRLIGEDDGFCVDRAFQRFWMATNRRRLHGGEFTDLASIIKYLKMCLASVLLDEARARRRAARLSLDEVQPEACISGDPSEAVVVGLTGRELWGVIDRTLAAPNERLIARLSFIAGLSPREILARHPERFTDVFDVYRAKRNMIERLRRNTSVQALLAPHKIHGRLHGSGDDAP
jgi:hypothetical protein